MHWWCTDDIILRIFLGSKGRHDSKALSIYYMYYLAQFYLEKRQKQTKMWLGILQTSENCIQLFLQKTDVLFYGSTLMNQILRRIVKKQNKHTSYGIILIELCRYWWQYCWFPDRSFSVSQHVLARKYFMRSRCYAAGAQRLFSAAALWKQRPISLAWDTNKFQHS